MSVTDTFAEFQRFEQQQQSVETQQLRQLTNKGQKGQLPRQIQRGKSEKQENQAVPLSVSLLPSSIIEMGGINAQFQRNADSDLSKFPLERFKGLIFNRLMLERLIESPQFDKCIVGLYSRVLVSSEPVREYGIVEILRISNDIPQDQRYIFAKMYCSKILRAEFSDKTTKQYRLIEFSNSLPELDDIIKWAQDKLNSGNELPTLQQIEKKERDLKQVFEDLNRRKKQKEQKPQIISDKQLALQIIELKDLIEAAKEEGDNIKAFELNKTQDNNKSEQLMKRANDALTHKSINKEEEEEYERQRQLKKYIETMQAKPKNALVNIFDPGV
ncbi:MAG: hypothetical protein EZS28_017462 [Streblomastix strix]|uniref:Plus3 domain-containing protein n=1 Tax=Streblomastix strix TaxID=222440 RepID=A0A5J4VWY0_9EUKA|nr:MAG: hypothetical protein EZS28_017462 [Streblomastix strix]